jgi:hypothetical protein
MAKIVTLVLTVLLTAQSAGMAAERPESSTWLLEKSIQKQLAGRAAVPRYKSLVPGAEKDESPEPAAANNLEIDPARHYISVLPSYYIGVQRHTLSTSECILRGTSMGATYGMLIGALGTTTGLFDDDDAYYIIGAMSILGALMGGTLGPESTSFSSEWRWEAARRQFDWREQNREKKFDGEK